MAGHSTRGGRPWNARFRKERVECPERPRANGVSRGGVEGHSCSIRSWQAAPNLLKGARSVLRLHPVLRRWQLLHRIDRRSHGPTPSPSVRSEAKFHRCAIARLPRLSRVATDIAGSSPPRASAQAVEPRKKSRSSRGRSARVEDIEQKANLAGPP